MARIMPRTLSCTFVVMNNVSGGKPFSWIATQSDCVATGQTRNIEQQRSIVQGRTEVSNLYVADDKLAAPSRI
jgi:hypothetical protein